MALADELTKWSGVRQDLAQKRAMRPYIGELAEIGRDFERSRAEQQKASAGLAGLQLQFEPQRQQQVTEQGRLVNLLNQMKIKQMQTQMEAPPPPLSNATDFGRYLIEQQEIEQKFGPESIQAQYYQQLIESKLPGAVGAQMLTPFEGPSGVPLEIVQTGEKDKTLRKDPVTNIFYKPVTDKRFNDNIEKIGVINSVVNDLDDLKTVAPIFQTGWKGNWRDAQVLISNYTGTQFRGTDKKAAGDAILATIKDKMMKLEGFPSLTQAYADAEKIVKIGKGESVPNYQERIGRLITKFEKEQKHLQDENQYGADITSRKPKEPEIQNESKKNAQEMKLDMAEDLEQSGFLKPTAQEMPEAAPGPGMFTEGLEALKTGFEGIVEPVGMGLRRAGAGIGQAVYPAIETLYPHAREAFGGLGLTGKLEEEMKAAEEAYGAKYGGQSLPGALAFGAEVAPLVAGGAAAGLAKAPAFLRAAGQKLPQLASAASMPRRLLTQAADKFPKLTGAAGIFGKGALAGAAAAPITYDPTFERLGLEGSLERAAEAAPLGGLLGLGVGGLARAPQALRKAFGKTGTLTAEEAPELLRKLEGTETPIGDVLDSPSLKRGFENIAQPVPFSGIPAKLQRLGTEIRQRGENIIKAITPEREGSVGEVLKAALITVNNKLENTKRALYKQVDVLAEKFGIEVNPQKYAQQAEELLGQTETSGIFGKIKDPARRELKEFLQEAANAQPGKVKDANIMIGELNNVAYELESEGKTFLAQKWKSMAQSLKNDLEDAMQNAGNPEEVKAAYDKAQRFFAEKIVPLREPEIMKYTYGQKGDPDTLVRDFVKTGITERPILLSKITKLLEPEDRKLLGQNLLSTAIDNGKLSPKKMINLYKKRDPRMKDQLFTKEHQKLLDDYVPLVEKNESALYAMANPRTGQQTKELQAFKLLAGVTAVPTLGNLGLLPPTIAAIVAARLGGKAMTSPRARRWLVEQSLKGKQPGFAQPGMVPSGAIGAGLPLISGTDRQGGMFDIPEFE